MIGYSELNSNYIDKWVTFFGVKKWSTFCTPMAIQKGFAGQLKHKIP
jgi:hypothetical protein